MSLTNPNKVVTEQRLNEYHNAILPYLGGMPEMVANKFSKGDLYSTEERMIGQWIDGKPLYQRTFVDTVPNVDSPKNIWQATGCDYKEIYSCSIKKVDEDSWFGVMENGGVSVWFSERAVGEAPYLRIANTQAGRNSAPIYITIRYTKTTDSAISIGSDTDYSTTEKIVGTWIDGKPIYRKSITITINGPSQENDGVSTIATDTDISSLNVEHLINVGGNIGNSATTIWERCIPAIWYGSNKMYNVDVYLQTSGLLRVITNRSSLNGLPATIIFEYTKTTD